MKGQVKQAEILISLSESEAIRIHKALDARLVHMADKLNKSDNEIKTSAEWEMLNIIANAFGFDQGWIKGYMVNRAKDVSEGGAE